MLHEELNQGFHHLELLPLGENRCAGKQRGYDVEAVLFLVNPMES